MASLIVTRTKMRSVVKFTKRSTQPEIAPKRFCGKALCHEHCSF